MRTDLLAGLNEQQHAAVTMGEGPVLVLAGPGSGKTGVLTRRIAYLATNMNVPARHIMAVTFTNKAAAEMRHRVQGFIGDQVYGLRIGTFHATCAMLLRREHQATPYGQDYVIYDTDDQLSAIGQAMASANIDTKKFNPRAILGMISSAKNEMITPKAYVAQDYMSEIVKRVYPAYQSILLDSNALDFDDLLLQTVLMFREHPEVLQKYQHQYPFILVDEFQDTNTVQYQLVRQIGAPQDNIMVVGDEDQSIYAFRGADYRNVLRFKQDYPDATTILLEQNYRSTQTVLDVARAVIDRNTNRTRKALFTTRGTGDPIIVYEAYDDDYEARYILGEINRLNETEGFNLSDIAVMYRTNTQSRALERAARDYGIPYTLVGGVSFYKRREVKDLLAYLRLILNPDDRVSFGRVINTPRRGIGTKSVEDFTYWAAKEGLSVSEALQRLIDGDSGNLSARVVRLFADFGQMLFNWQSIALTGDLVRLYDTVMSDIGYSLHIHSTSKDEDEANERTDNLGELRGLLVQAVEMGQTLAEFVTDQMLMTDADIPDESNADKITMLTLHAAKGLEYPVVFITGLENGLLPHFRALEEPGGVEEERRLFYVGITRAKDRLYITYAFRRTTYTGSMAGERSPFLADIPPELFRDETSGLSWMREEAQYRSVTRWDNQVTSRLDRDLEASRRRSSQINSSGNSELRGKIIRFPGNQSDSEASAPAPEFKTGQRVKHSQFGSGTVIESRMNGRDEEVTVAFVDRRYGIKTLLASVANLKRE